MSATSTVRLPRALALGVLAALAVLALPAAASAQEQAPTSSFHRFEVNAQANYSFSEPCPAGSARSTSITRVTVIGGYEEETEFGETTSDEFLTVRYQTIDCEGLSFNTQGTGVGDFTYSPSLQTASVSGTITLRDGSTATVNMSWDGTGPLETNTNNTQFPGFTGIFVGKRRDAVATGTVVINGETVVNGSTTSADIETLEDNNRDLPERGPDSEF
jgi:hypothetical protein